jgi:hypothetical protein
MWTTSAFLLKSFQRIAGVFHIIGIMRRLADYYLNKAPTLDEMKKAHRKFIRDYNCQIHFAHRERNDNRHSPQDVLRGVLELTLWTLGPDEWLLFLKLPDYAARKKPQRKPDVIQLPLPDLDENQRQQVSS